MRVLWIVMALICVMGSVADARADAREDVKKHVEMVNPEAFVRMLDDWNTQWGDSADLKAARQFAQTLEQKRSAALQQVKSGDLDGARKFLAEHRKHIMSQPLVKGMKIIAARRNLGGNARKNNNPGVPGMACYNMVDEGRNLNSDIVQLSDFTSEKVIETPLYTHPNKSTIHSMDLHFGAKKILFIAKSQKNNHWVMYEVGVDGKGVKQLTPDSYDFDIADCCYLPDGKMIVMSDAPEQGLPCESGKRRMTNSYRFDPATQELRRLTYDQDSNWYPSVLNDGRVLYVRWEYCDQSHFFSRIVMTMHPDGTRQLSYFGTNGFWPNHYGNPLAIPGENAKFIAVATGHHTSKAGQLCLFDGSRARAEASGAVQMVGWVDNKTGMSKSWKQPIPDGEWNKTQDYLYSGKWPKYLQPYPLGSSPRKDGAGKYFLTTMKPYGSGLWGVYLVDVFDNITLLYEDESAAYNEPIAIKARPTPPVIPDRVKWGTKQCTVHVADVYQGPGLRGVPKGTVKALRIFAYHYAYIKAGSHEGVGTESSWDMKYVLGTVPVAEDGSAYFIAPANQPIAIQPLAADGSAIQLMRSWTVGMPGEHMACIGCHESANSILKVPVLRKKPVAITPWNEGKRTWNFLREVQPVLNRKCVGCHNKDIDPAVAGKQPNEQGVLWFEQTEFKPFLDCRKPNFADIRPMVIRYRKPENNGIIDSGAGAFSKSYHYLNPYVRRPGPESDNHLFNPMEYNANTSYLIQMLRKGHHGVTLTPTEWQVFYTWIDLNVPFWGTWLDFGQWWSNESHRNWIGIRGPNQQISRIEESRKRRNDAAMKFQGFWDPNADPELDRYDFAKAEQDLKGVKFTPPAKRGAKPVAVRAPKGWPFAATPGKELSVELPGGTMTFRRIPAGSFVMGDVDGSADEAPKVETIAKPFYMAEFELSNGQFKAFQAEHYNGYVDELGKDHTRPGISMMEDQWPAIRVSAKEANDYCKWVSGKIGKTVRLPTEEEWEWAARAGTDTPFFWGKDEKAFGEYANLADKALNELGSQRQTLNYYLRDMDVNDGEKVIAPANKQYKPNGFGLYNMIGNVAEWTRSRYAKGSPDAVCRGGAWEHLPRMATVYTRTPYLPWQRIANVGIRLVIEE